MQTLANKKVEAREVLETLGKHMLVDGYHVVMDLEKSRGSYLYDARSDRFILDFFTNFATCPLGYNHPRVDDPEFRERLARAAVNKPANSDIYTQILAEWVATFCRLAVPESHQKHMFFVEGGSVAVENALKTAFDWKVRKNLAKGVPGEKGSQIIHFRHAFHGRTGYTLSLTNTADLRKTQYFPKFDWPRISCPGLSFPVTEAVIAEVEKLEAFAIAEIKQALVDRRDDIAALIIEPIQGEGGDNHFRPEFLQALRRLADENEFLLICDEIQTGVGLTGSMWAWQQMGIVPDIFIFGKKTQVCGIAATSRIDDVENVFKISSRINSTWGGNLVDMLRATRFFEIIDEEKLVDNARRVGEHLLLKLRAVAEEMPEVMSNVRGRGLFIAFDLPDAELRGKTLSHCLDHGLMGLASGARAIRFRPALNLTIPEADEGVEKLRAALQSLTGRRA
jgi:L-lysine 6-transaminase